MPLPVVALALLLVQTPPATAVGGTPLAFEPVPELIGVGVGAAVWVLSESVFKANLAPTACRWCDRAADGSDTLNAVDRWGRGVRAKGTGSQHAADVAS